MQRRTTCELLDTRKEHRGGGGELSSPKRLSHSRFHRPMISQVFLMLLASTDAVAGDGAAAKAVATTCL